MPHNPTDACHKEHCYFHHEDEPITPTTYTWCGECMHAYQTAEDLVNAYIATMDEALKGESFTVPEPDKIAFCPLCAHDF